MSKAILLSINPRWCSDIASGQKTIEIRKNRPSLEAPFKCYIYCTKGKNKNPHEVLEIHSSEGKMEKANGKVIGEFTCDNIVNYEAELWDDKTFERIQELYEPDDFSEHGEYEYRTIADNSDEFWKENKLCEASCVSIEALRKYIGTGINRFFGWHISNFSLYDKPIDLGDFLRATGCTYPWDCRACNFWDSMYSICEKPVKPPQSWCYVHNTLARKPTALAVGSSQETKL